MNPFTASGILLQSTSTQAGAAAGVAFPAVGSPITPCWPSAQLASNSFLGRMTPQSQGKEAVSKAAQSRGWSSTRGWSGAQLGSHTAVTSVDIICCGTLLRGVRSLQLVCWQSRKPQENPHEKHCWCLSRLLWKVLITCLTSAQGLPYHSPSQAFPGPAGHSLA